MSLYTVGNWTVDQLTADSISDPKSLTLVDLDYAHDYSVASRDAAEVRLANKTGAGITPVEQLRYGRQKVKDVYNQFDVQSGQRMNVTEGVRTLAEVKTLLKATNSVSGQEILIPLRGWICLEVPTADFVTPVALELLLKRTVAASLATGSVNGDLAVAMARGDLDPQL